MTLLHFTLSNARRLTRQWGTFGSERLSIFTRFDINFSRMVENNLVPRTFTLPSQGKVSGNEVGLRIIQLWGSPREII